MVVQENKDPFREGAIVEWLVFLALHYNAPGIMLVSGYRYRKLLLRFGVRFYCENKDSVNFLDEGVFCNGCGQDG